MFDSVGSRSETVDQVVEERLTERAFLLTFDKRHSSGFSYYEEINSSDDKEQCCGQVVTRLVKQRLNFLLFLSLADLIGVGNLKELRRNFNEPFGFDCCDRMTVFPCCQNEFVVY